MLRCFSKGPRQTLTALSGAIDLPHSTVLRFLVTLENEGYVRKEGALWSLTPQVLEIGFAALENTGVTEVIQASLQDLADTCSGTVNIGEKGKDEVVIIARLIAAAQRQKIVIVNLRVGNTLPKSSALYSALDQGDQQWSIVEYADRLLVTAAIALFNSPSRSLSLGISVDMDAYPRQRIESELIPLLRKERNQIRRLMHLGQL